MSNELTFLPNEIWNTIIDFCSDNPHSIAHLSEVNKQISEIALEKLKNIKINVDKLYTSFYKIQDLYTKKYCRSRQLGHPHDIKLKSLGKFVLLEVQLFRKYGVICEHLRVISQNSPNLTNNQILITPIFGKKRTLEKLQEENHVISYSRAKMCYYGFLQALGPPDKLPLKWLDHKKGAECPIAQNRLPIRKITVKTRCMNPYILAAINLAEEKVSRQFYKFNGSYGDVLNKWLWFIK